jgi:glycerol uptake facilitator protein
MSQTPFMGELIGTLILVLLGDGVVANVLLKGSKGESSGWIVITAGWAFAVMCGVFVSQKFGGAGHLNPAVTIAMAVKSGDWSNVLSFISAQMIGGFLGACLVWLTYLPHWGITEDKGAKLGIFCTAPAIRNTTANIIAEVIGTMVLVLVSSTFYTNPENSGLTPVLVGFLIWSIGLSLGGPTGYALNPARDLAPRLAHAILPIAGKGGNDWNYSWIPVVGPIVGGVLAALFLVAFGM